MKIPDKNQVNGQSVANNTPEPGAAAITFPQADSCTATVAASGKRVYRTARHAATQANSFPAKTGGYDSDISVTRDSFMIPVGFAPPKANDFSLNSGTVVSPQAVLGTFPPVDSDYTNGFAPNTDEPPTPQKGGETAAFASQKANPPSIMPKDREANGKYPQPSDAQPKQEQNTHFESQSPFRHKPLAPPKAIPLATPPADTLGASSAHEGFFEEPSANSAMPDPAAGAASGFDTALPYAQQDSDSQLPVQPATVSFLHPVKGLPKKIVSRGRRIPSDATDSTFQASIADQQTAFPAAMQASGLPGDAKAVTPDITDDITDPYTYEWQELLAALRREKVLTDQPRTPNTEDFVPFEPQQEDTFPKVPDRSAIPSEEPLDLEPSPTTGQTASTPKASKLTPKDFSVAFGRNRSAEEAVNQEVASAFARAWADDETAIKYDGAYHVEADAPPSKDSRAASGWMPGDPTEEQVVTNVPYTSLASNMVFVDDENLLFEAYGASYAEAYAVALELEFSEEKPVPDDNTGDVTGLTSSILHTPSGEPILLGTVMPEDHADDTSSPNSTEHADNGSADVSEPHLSVGRKVVRYLLMVLGAGTVAVAALYFAGLLI